MTKPAFLTTPHGTRIAYHRTHGAGPGIVFLGGFMSDMEGSKALALEAWAKAEGRAFLRFDYQGHGQSDGAFADGTIGLWARDALAALDTLTEGPQLLVGSSMGGWIALKLAKARPGRVRGMVGVAAAPDFTPRMWADLTAEQQAAITEKGFVDVPTQYGDTPYRLTRALFEDGWRERVMGSPLHLDIPVRLIQGTADPDVPWAGTLDIARGIRGGDVEIILVPEGDHRLSTDRDLKRLVRITREVADGLR
ncbi:alpha/beta fold hydrolase [Gimibacter soli]|uniref:Alpha/beta hydrolase n=1 Tax=Gimibacter soli TaxID=3024400 RepID=A0AAE9XVI9_9PROT|nr:alpha/beta hydrolase [Gimibacter soli]WCL54663.1 alpha/beta hydrolase [Gimibacter soli]